MTNSQEWFDNKYSERKQKLENIRIIDGGEFAGQLTIKNYPNLEKIYLRNFYSIEKLTLHNLESLQECNVLNCEITELTIKNCSQTKVLNLYGNSLKNLEFLKELNSLNKIELDNNPNLESGLEYLPDSLESFSYENTKLTEILKFYQGDWKSYKKEFQELTELFKHNPQQVLKNIRSLKEEIKKLKEKRPISLDSSINFEKKYQKLKGSLNFLLTEEELKTQEINKLVTSELTDKVAEQKDNLLQTKEQLNNLHEVNSKLKSKLAFFEQIYQTTKKNIKDKETRLEEILNDFLTKSNSYKKEKLEKNLAKLLSFQADIITLNAPSALKEKTEIEAKLIEKTLITKEEVEQICSLQSEIIRLKLRLQKDLNHINQTFHVNIKKIDRSIVHFESSFADNSSGGNINTQIEKSPK